MDTLAQAQAQATITLDGVVYTGTGPTIAAARDPGEKER